MFNLTFCDATTGIILNSDGKYDCGQLKEGVLESFEDLELAIMRKDQLLNNFVFGEVYIKNSDTNEGNTYHNESELPIYLKEKLIFESWQFKNPILKLFLKRPKLKYF